MLFLHEGNGEGAVSMMNKYYSGFVEEILAGLCVGLGLAPSGSASEATMRAQLSMSMSVNGNGKRGDERRR